MANYAVDPELLAPLVPAGTELDQFEGKTYVSLVGFRFLRARVRGLWIPFHSNFDEVNLRFYVRREAGNSSPKRGVAFVCEVVPRYAIAAAARALYQEKYLSLPMTHKIVEPTSEHGRLQAEYRWRHEGQWNRLRAECSGKPLPARPGSLEQFITEHYWGYSAQPAGGSIEYQVTHEPWRIWTATTADFEGHPANLYGADLAACLRRTPDSAFLAEGSAVTVYSGQPIR
jgi:uncharacterized protein YqjF (DUF2071 family)